jgi:hypothetical protein
MLYGYFVQNDPASSLRHTVVPATPCVSYWDDPTLSKSELNQLLRRADKSDVAFSIASFSGTPVDTIRYADRASQHQPDCQYPLGAAGAVERVHLHTAVFAG